MSTRMACDEDAMQAEAEFLARLADSVGAQLDGDTLALVDSDGAVLLEFRAEGTVGLAGEWVVNGLHFPAREAVMSVHGELLVSFDDDGVSGFAGCNSFSGAFDADGDSVRIGPLMSTRRFCGEDEESDGPSVMEQEAALLAALENSVTARLEGDRLILLRPDGGISVTLHRG
jgi:heat shock protein HslJ